MEDTLHKHTCAPILSREVKQESSQGRKQQRHIYFNVTDFPDILSSLYQRLSHQPETETEAK